MLRVLSKLLLINAFFALFNPFETTKITSVLFSMFELNKILCKTNLYLQFLYFVSFCITTSELIEI